MEQHLKNSLKLKEFQKAMKLDSGLYIGKCHNIVSRTEQHFNRTGCNDVLILFVGSKREALFMEESYIKLLQNEKTINLRNVHATPGYTTSDSSDNYYVYCVYDSGNKKNTWIRRWRNTSKKYTKRKNQTNGQRSFGENLTQMLK
jgi:hypothetical protein